MEYIDTKNFIESIVYDLGNSRPLSEVFNKLQILAFKLKNDNFSNWVKKEIEGYSEKDEIPEYRRLENLEILVKERNGIDNLIPYGFFKDEEIEKVVRRCDVRQKLITIEPFEKNIEETTTMCASMCLYEYIQSRYMVPIHVFYLIPNSLMVGILSSIRTELITFLLQINEELGDTVDFGVINKKIDNWAMQTINAGVVNLGTGHIEITGGNIVGGLNNTVSISADTRQQLNQIVNQIENLSKDAYADRVDIAQAIADIKQLVNNEDSKPKFISMALNALKGVLGNVVTSEISTLIERGLKLI